MAQCVKVFINSLYGKFGQNHFDIDIIMSQKEFDDEVTFKEIIKNKMEDIKNLYYSDADELI